MYGKILSSKRWAHDHEGYANQDGEELKQLESKIKEEGLFCVEWCLVISVSIISYEVFFTMNTILWLV